jgi:hypothetical protein
MYYGQFVPPRSPKGYGPSAVAADTLTAGAGKLTFAMMYERTEPWPIFELQEPSP